MADGSEMSFTVCVPNFAVGSIIGKGGEHINYIQTTSGTHIDVAKPEQSYPGTDLRPVTVKGSPAEIGKAVELIAEKIEEEERRTGNKGSGANPGPSAYGNQNYGQTSTVTVHVPNQAVGTIIGKGGEAINQIQVQSGAHVDIGRPEETIVESDQRPVRITGTQVAIELARSLIGSKLMEVNTRLGYGPGMFFGAPVQAYSNGGAVFPAPQMPYPPMQQVNPQLLGPTATVTVHVPNHAVGTIIGKGGEAINQIQAKAGVHIDIAKEEDTTASGERPVQITGTDIGRDYAKQLIAAKLAVAEGLSGAE